jgi:hypothetical protein
MEDFRLAPKEKLVEDLTHGDGCGFERDLSNTPVKEWPDLLTQVHDTYQQRAYGHSEFPQLLILSDTNLGAVAPPYNGTLVLVALAGASPHDDRMLLEKLVDSKTGEDLVTPYCGDSK